MSADYMIEILMRNSNRLKPIYQQMLLLYRNGESEKAFELFGTKTGTKAGKNFAVILSKLELINPAELIEQIEVYKKMLLEEQTTEAMRRVERNSVLITAWASASIFALLINFLFVSVLMDTLYTLQHLF